MGGHTGLRLNKALNSIAGGGGHALELFGRELLYLAGLYLLPSHLHLVKFF